jgi:flagellar motor switch protein FliG
MTVILVVISFVIIWLVTTFFIIRNIKILKNDLLKKISETEKPPEKESENIQEENKGNRGKPFDFIKHANLEKLLYFIQQEHPQIIALVLAHLEPVKASSIMEKLPLDMLGEVAGRIATLDRVSPEIISEIEQALKKKLTSLSGEGNDDYSIVGGIENIVEILRLVNRDSEKKIIEALEREDPELSEEIKKRMFVFEDILMLDDKAVQRILLEVDSQELAKALMSVDHEIWSKIFKNMSKLAVYKLEKKMKDIKPVCLKDVEESQQRIVSIILSLEEKGEIIYNTLDNNLKINKI